MEALMGYEDMSDEEKVQTESEAIVTITPKHSAGPHTVHPDSVQKSKKEVLFTVMGSNDSIVAETTADELSSVSGSSSTSLPIVYCEICQENEKRYKCPRCAVVTCCLDCVKKHKQETGCSGVRDKTQYVPMKSFGDRELRSDFHFLEDALQKRDTAQRTYVHDTAGNRGTKVPKSNPHKKRGRQKGFKDLAQFDASYQNLENYSKGVKNLFHAAKDRGIKLLLMPPGMSKRNYNTSHLDHKSKALKWRVNVAIILNEHFSVADVLPYETHCCGRTTQDKLVHFQQGHEQEDINIATSSDHFIYSLHASIVGVTLESISENDTIVSVLQSIFDNAQTGSKLKHLLKPFLNNISSFLCLMKKIPSPANDPLYCKLLLDQTLKEALTGQTILEYPTFYFCPEVAAEKFKLMIAEVGTTEVADETKQSFSKRDRPNHNKKRGIQELGSSIDVQDGHKKANTAAKKVEFAEEVNGGDENVENEDVSDNEEGEESEGTDSEDEEGYDEFMKALVDLQDADTSVLQQFIKQAEEQLKQ